MATNSKTKNQPSAARSLIQSLFGGKADAEAPVDALERARSYHRQIAALDGEHAALTARAEQLHEQRTAALLDAEPEEVDAIEAAQRETDRDRDRLKIAGVELAKRRDAALVVANEERLDRIAAAVNDANKKAISIDAEIKRLIAQLSTKAFAFNLEREMALALLEHIEAASPDRAARIAIPQFDSKRRLHQEVLTRRSLGLEHWESHSGRTLFPPFNDDAFAAQLHASIAPVLRPVSLDEPASAGSNGTPVEVADAAD